MLMQLAGPPGETHSAPSWTWRPHLAGDTEGKIRIGDKEGKMRLRKGRRKVLVPNRVGWACLARMQLS